MRKKSTEVKSLLAQARHSAFMGITDLLSEFQKLELACELDNGVFWSEGFDEQDEPYLALYVVEDENSQLGIGVEIWHQGNNHGVHSIEKCETPFLLEVLEQMEVSLALAKASI
jgi:hypothetical protein